MRGGPDMVVRKVASTPRLAAHWLSTCPMRLFSCDLACTHNAMSAISIIRNDHTSQLPAIPAVRTALQHACSYQPHLQEALYVLQQQGR